MPLKMPDACDACGHDHAHGDGVCRMFLAGPEELREFAWGYFARFDTGRTVVRYKVCGCERDVRIGERGVEFKWVPLRRPEPDYFRDWFESQRIDPDTDEGYWQATRLVSVGGVERTLP